MSSATQSKRVLITGASGLLGRTIIKHFSESGWVALGLAFSRAVSPLVKADITDHEEMSRIVSEFKPDAIVHAAAERHPDIAEKNPDKVWKINVDATKNIAALASLNDSYLVYISTDYVFDGTSAPYSPSDLPNPLNNYGRSKLDGEKAVLENYTNSAVLRVPILYGDVESLGESAVTVLFSAIKDNSKQTEMCDYQRRFPTYCGDVAVVCEKLCSAVGLQSQRNGIFHWSSNEMLTKFRMTQVISEATGLSMEHLIQKSDAPLSGTNRPYDTQLDCSRLEGLDIICERTPFRDGIMNCLKPFL